LEEDIPDGEEREKILPKYQQLYSNLKKAGFKRIKKSHCSVWKKL
jgi:hypothetical protein